MPKACDVPHFQVHHHHHRKQIGIVSHPLMMHKNRQGDHHMDTASIRQPNGDNDQHGQEITIG
jgi:hypothetical protein